MLSSAIDKGVKKGKGKQINEFAAVFGMPGKDENVQFDPSIFMNPSMSFNNGSLFDEPPDDIVIEQIISYQQSYNGCYIPIHIEREIVKGRMRKTESETIYINVDKGVDENEMINISQKGNIKDGIASDVKVKILLEKHREYTRRGIDLVFYIKAFHIKKVCVDLNSIWNILTARALNSQVREEMLYKMEMKKQLISLDFIAANS